ncbi:hypothetical protein SAMN05192534_12461 [Alteribacillus persepolensis]|uniref:Uncharacterized protein n=1 Tax=Alteribacillus persepolensis TaxID=568899 RepID=A0A1G8IKC1_9BACI|nr:hypothetical protein [Alteribacillus persepolensis]SDI19478.1 hypothetical protein SAMN05192534_12461 [Alteribacillus persepolensis]
MEVVIIQSLNRGFSKEIVQAMLHGGFGSRKLNFSFALLNENDRSIGDITHLVIADSSEVSMDSEAEIHRTAKLRVRDTGEIDFLKERIQPFAELHMKNGSIEFPLGVFLLSTPQKEYEGDNIYRNIDAYDKLQILVDDGFTARVVADEGELVTDFIISLLQDAGITKINIERSDKTFPTWLSWDPDVSRLEVINELLDVINYENLYVDEYGYFVSRPYRTPAQRSAEYTYETNHLSVITPGATSTEDYFSVPNQWVGIVSEPDRVPLTYTYENTKEDSPTSIPSRGRTITKYIDTDSVDLEALQGTVQKQAYQDSQIAAEMKLNTAIMPMHSYNDIIRVKHDKLGIDAKFQEVAWSMPLSAGGTMSHTIKEVIDV